MHRAAGLFLTEWGGLWIMAVLALINIVLAVWRPRLYRRAEN